VRYVSLFDGIGAAHAAWMPLGWECLWTAEIERFPIAVVERRFPGIPNLGDVTAITEEMLRGYPKPDLVIGGSPCQSFSVAGLRGGLADPRGNLALRFVQLVGALAPRWVVWENVPGVLSSGSGRDFGSILGALAELGYGWGYRVLDAQYYGVAQRRRRVFVVGCLGDWRRAAAVLSVAQGMRGDPAPSRTPRQGPAADAGQGASGASWWDGGQLSQTLDAVVAKGQTMPEKNRFPAVLEQAVAHTSDGVVADPITTAEGKTWTNKGNTFRLRNCVQQTMAVRRLTPLECERLQGFPDGWTQIPWRKKPAEECPDGPRYRALGNSMAVPVIRWIGERIAKSHQGSNNLKDDAC
jgi:DNA (cytosine-5)-methyltransferase 1